MGLDFKRLTYFILNRWEPNSNDKELLSLISSYFGVDFTLIGFVEFENILSDESDVKFDYFISNVENVSEREKDLSSLYFSGAFRESIETNRIVNIDNYKSYKYAVDEWKRAGITSILTVPITKSGEVFGAIQIAYVDKKDVKFSKSEEDDLKLIADLIASVIEGKFKEFKISLHRRIEDLHLDIASSLLNFSFDSSSLESWLIDNLRKILVHSGAYIMGFIMPSEGIYCVVDLTGRHTSCRDSVTEDIKRWITYSLFELGVNEVITFSEAKSRYGFRISERSMELGLKDGLYVPIEYNSKLLAYISYGFREKVEKINYHKAFLKNVGMHLVMAVLSFRNLSALTKVLTQGEEQFVRSLMKMSELRDSYTKGHSERVALYAKAIADTVGKTTREMNIIYTAGLFHDIGKIGIPDSILLKPGRLSKHEYEIIKYHPLFSYEMIKDVKRLADIVFCVKHHHERCDGSGYPDGLKCDEIDWCTRILAIADVFDALTSDRVYRENRRYSPPEAIKIMKEMPLDTELLGRVEDVLVNNYFFEEWESSLPYIEEVESERKNIFLKDYLTGADRLKLFSIFVSDRIKKGTPFILFEIDIKDLGYINYVYGIDYANALIEYMVSRLMECELVERVMRDGADSFVCFVEKDKDGFLEFLDRLDTEIKIRFLNDDASFSRYENGVLYKVFVRFPEDGMFFEDLLYGLRMKLKKQRVCF